MDMCRKCNVARDEILTGRERRGHWMTVAGNGFVILETWRKKMD